MVTRSITLYRGTTELWEQCVIEARLPPPNIKIFHDSRSIYGSEELVNERIRQNVLRQPCSLLRSGKEVVMGKTPLPLMRLSADAINKEIVVRVGIETARGTPNFNSHFVPCSPSPTKSRAFGHKTCYRFQIHGRFYRKHEIDLYVQERQTLPSYVVPLFEGEHNEVLAYTGSLITSVVFMSGESVQSMVMNSLD